MDTRVSVRLFFRGALLHYDVKIYRGKCQSLFTGNILRGVFCEQRSQKTRELRREIMHSMISVHREACCWSRSEQ